MHVQQVQVVDAQQKMACGACVAGVKQHVALLFVVGETRDKVRR
jgi:hypothetical protein